MPSVPNLKNHSTRHFQTPIYGYTINLSEVEAEDRTSLPESVSFTGYRFHDKEKGQDINVGVLATDEQDIIEVLLDDTNVVQIDEKAYKAIVENGTKI